MKKKNFNSLKLNKKSISKLYRSSIKGGTDTVYSDECPTNDCSEDCTDDCSNYCTGLEECPSSWIIICGACEF
jgi:hypothetical protein